MGKSVSDDNSQMAVYRYELLRPGRHTDVTLQEGAEIVGFEIKGEEFNLWAVVVTKGSAVKRNRRFTVVPTGHPWRVSSFRYLRSCHHINKGGFHTVWHLLEGR